MWILLVFSLFRSLSNGISCDEWASSVSNTCKNKLVTNTGEIFLNRDGNIYTDKSDGDKVSIIYKEYYYDDVDYDTLIPILVVHGGPGFPAVYLDTYKYLACPVNSDVINIPKYRVVFYDQFCVAASTKQCNNTNVENFPEVASLPRYMNEIRSVISATIGNKKFHLLGQSAGGALVSQFSITYNMFINSGQVLSLILANPVSPNGRLGAQGIYKRMRSMLPNKYVNVLENNDINNKLYEESETYFMQMFYYHAGVMPDCLENAVNNINEYVFTKLWADCDWCSESNTEMMRMDLTNDIKNVKIPILYFISEFDIINVDDAILFGKNNDYATFYLIQAGSHLPHIESFDETYKLVECWLDKDCKVPQHDLKAYKNAQDVMKKVTKQFTR